MSKYGVFSGPYFSAIALNMERYSVSVRIQSECGKIPTRKNSVFWHFSRIVSELISFYSTQNRQKRYWNRSWLICPNSRKIRSTIWRWSLKEAYLKLNEPTSFQENTLISCIVYLLFRNGFGLSINVLYISVGKICQLFMVTMLSVKCI